MKSVPTKLMHCPECRTEWKIYDPLHVMFYACQSCNTVFRMAVGGEIRKEWAQDRVPRSFIVPGLEMELEGVKWTVLTAMRLRTADQSTYWREFRLYHPDHSDAGLSEIDGHWHFMRPCAETPKVHGAHADYRGRRFHIINNDKVEIYHLIGEFTDDLTSAKKYTEYIDPPYFISCESSDSGKQWWEGRYMPAKEITRSNPLLNTIPIQHGVGMAQPNRWKSMSHASWPLAFTAAVLLLFIGFFSWTRSSLALDFVVEVPKTIVNTTPPLPTDTLQNNASSSPTEKFPEPFVTSPSFELTASKTALEIDATVDELSNNWVSAQMILVNEQNGDETEFWQDVEYYSGSDGGESWTEGSKKNYSILSAIPAGKYHLLVRASQPNGLSARDMRVEVHTNPALLSNFGIALILLFLFPALLGLFSTAFETRRWSNSNYDPPAK